MDPLTRRQVTNCELPITPTPEVLLGAVKDVINPDPPVCVDNECPKSLINKLIAQLSKPDEVLMDRMLGSHLIPKETKDMTTKVAWSLHPLYKNEPDWNALPQPAQIEIAMQGLTEARRSDVKAAVDTWNAERMSKAVEEIQRMKDIMARYETHGSVWGDELKKQRQDPAHIAKMARLAEAHRRQMQVKRDEQLRDELRDLLADMENQATEGNAPAAAAAAFDAEMGDVADALAADSSAPGAEPVAPVVAPAPAPVAAPAVALEVAPAPAPVAAPSPPVVAASPPRTPQQEAVARRPTAAPPTAKKAKKARKPRTTRAQREALRLANP